MRIAAFEDINPSPELGYGYARAFHILTEFVALGHDLTLVTLHDVDCGLPSSHVLPKRNCRPWKTRNDWQAFCETQLHHFDLIWVSRPKNLQKVLPLVRRAAPKVPVVYDAEAVGALREIRRREVTGDPMTMRAAERLLASELALMRECDVIVSVSRNEADIISHGTARPTYLVGHPCRPHVHDLLVFEERQGLIFVGSFFDIETNQFRPEYSPNLAALQYYLNDVAPLVRADVSLEIIGFGSDKALAYLYPSKMLRIAVRGFQPSLRPFYRSAALLIAPTVFAAGIPWKVTEAFAEGIPVVMTRLLANQLCIRGDDFLVADTPQQFAELIDAASRDPHCWRRAQDAGYRYARDYCDPTDFSFSLDSALKRARSVSPI